VLDAALLAALVVVALQALPLPRAVVAVLSPATVRHADALSLEEGRAWLAISLRPAATIEALVIASTGAAVFWSARELFRQQGVRRAIRTIAVAGAIASFAGLLQRKSGSNLVYGFWQPAEAGAWPFGPFVNRNFFATWVLMAIPICGGYLLARRPARLRRDVRPWRVRVAHALDGRAIWLMTVLGLMTVALFASLSRSGAIGLVGVTIVGWAGAQFRGDPPSRYGLGFGLVAIALAVLLWGDVPGLLARIEHTNGIEPGDRQAIWRDTWPLVREHWLVGTGAGAYQWAMLFYQQTDRTYYDNQAHNQFLQIAADGGLLLAVPACVVLVALTAGGLRRLRHDRTGMYWIRLGAAAGLSGVLVQGFWETGLRAPANAVLSGVLAAILLHLPIATDQANRTGP
jgi:O-antigen ligase